MCENKILFSKAILGLFITMSGSALALDGNFYVGGQLGQARGEVGSAEMNERMAKLGYDAHAIVSGQNRTAWELVGGYQFSDYFALEAGYVDLGEVRTRLSGSPVDIQDYLNSANLVHPRSADGYELAVLGRYPFDEKNSVYVRGGLLFAGSRYQADAQTDFAKRSASGNDGFIGIGYEYEINDRWDLQVNAQNYHIEDENIKLIGIGFHYKFHSLKKSVMPAQEPLVTQTPVVEKPQPITSNPCLMPEPPSSCNPESTAVVSIELAVQFDTNSDVVKANYLNDILKLAEFLKAHINTKVIIEGHTDDQGDANLNKDLSLRRAKAVRNMLVEKFGIAADRVTSDGYGEERPVATNATAEGRDANRRVIAKISGIN